MAVNSAITMPLNRCCILKVQQRTLDDRQGDMIWCPDCDNYLIFNNGAWKLANLVQGWNNEMWISHDE